LSGLATMRRSAPASVSVPLTRDGPALLIYAAFGGPADSIVRLERRVAAAIDGSLPQAERVDARREYLTRPATLAFPEIRFQSLPELEGTGDPLLDAQLAAWTGRPDSARGYFEGTSEQRRSVLPEALSFDGLYPEARLLAFLGDTTAALAWGEPSLQALGRVEPRRLAAPVNTASLMRLIALYAVLNDRMGDRGTARTWARVITILWDGADPDLRPVVHRMERLLQ